MYTFVTRQSLCFMKDALFVIMNSKGPIFSTDHSAMRLPFLVVLKPNTDQVLMPDWSIYLTVLRKNADQQ